MFGRSHPLISGALPEPAPDNSVYPVGNTFVRCRPLTDFKPTAPTLKSTGQPAFDMRYVDYSVFYPSVASEVRQEWVDWFPPHKRAMSDGFEKYLKMGFLSWTGGSYLSITWRTSEGGLRLSVRLMCRTLGRVKFPAHCLAPLAPRKQDRGRSMVIFSHGLCGSRHTYSQYCSALAAAGHVVLSIESRDGSGPAVMMPHDQGGGEDALLYVALDDLEWGKGQEGSLKEMGEIQLDLRVREIYETYHHFRHLVTHGLDQRTIQVGHDATEDRDTIDRFVSSLGGNVDLESLYLSGHSFGGGTMLHVLQAPPPIDGELPPLPIKGCIALDPWVELLADRRPPPTEISPHLPVLCINSPGFTGWTSHFELLREILQANDSTLVTLIGTGHMSFSDFALLKPGRTAPALSLLRQVASLAISFIDGSLFSNNLIAESWARHRDDVANNIKGKSGNVACHLLPEEQRVSVGAKAI